MEVMSYVEKLYSRVQRLPIRRIAAAAVISVFLLPFILNGLMIVFNFGIPIPEQLECEDRAFDSNFEYHLEPGEFLLDVGGIHQGPGSMKFENMTLKPCRTGSIMDYTGSVFRSKLGLPRGNVS